MTIFSQFKSDQLWMVLVQRENKTRHIEHWLAPAGLDGTRRIFRNMKPDRVPLAAITLKDLGRLKRSGEGVSQSILTKLLGEEQAVFVMGNDDGSSKIVSQRAKTSTQAVSKCGLGAAAVAGFAMSRIHDHMLAMRRLLDNQDPRAADVNLLRGNGLPGKDFFDDPGSATPMHTLWSKQPSDDEDE